ncbi:hypothetical protein BDA99DRAFT_517600 [Phascolomyces articulosus]|uniref:F-box domain-containing protein n=1 Tax=Phascolomyces articulosus TaxID=60185 RepID=A0AAD5PD94_9FUNG|nr:hypothetical protein BDA99DRAFT_517600 [Phascolomyces articulosus]
MSKRKSREQGNDRDPKRNHSDDQVKPTENNILNQLETAVERTMNDKSAIDNRHCDDRRFDFIQRLPYEILPIILNEFSTRERLKLLDVSHVWRSRLTSDICSKVWSEIEINEGYILLGNLKFIAHHVVDLSLVCVEKGDLIDQVLIQMASKIFTKLQVFSIIGCAIECNASIQFALLSVTDTLKALVIDDAELSSLFSPMPVKIFLSLCKNLEKFHYTHCRMYMIPEMMGFLYPGTRSNALPLKDLTLSVGSIPESEVETILRHCPGLRILNLHGCSNQILRSINHYCPKLEYLTIKGQSMRPLFYEVTPLPSRKFERDQGGGRLRYLDIGISDVEDLVTILTTYSVTLEALLVQFSEDNPEGQDLNALKKLDRMPNIQFLSVLDANARDTETVVILLRKLSNRVTHIYFDCCYLYANEGAILEVVKENFNHLVDLRFYGIKSIHPIALTRLLAKFITTNTLKSFFCEQCDAIPTDAMMDMVALIPTLSHITLDFSCVEKELLTGQGFCRFCRNLRMYRRPLEWISLHCIPGCAEEGIKQLRAIKSIKLMQVDGELVKVKEC